MNVYLDDRRIELRAAASIGTGGEADVYDIGGGRALKIFKDAGHPDFAGLDHARDAARQRLDTHQRKLPDFPRKLPERVITPMELARDRRKRGRIIGYSMRLVSGAELLYRYAEPRMRRQGVCGNQVVAFLRDLHETVGALHDAGVVIGDFNDLNVLVAGTRAYLIDADSFQFGPYACSVFTERFVDPLLCDPGAAAPVLVGRYTLDSDWYAFHVMAMRALLCVGPYGGVHKPADARRRIAHAARPLHRVTVFDREVVYPRPALHYSVLPDELVAHLDAVFCRDHRAPFPGALLDDLRWTQCRQCGAEHARPVCPQCRRRGAGVALVHVLVRGKVRAERVAMAGGQVGGQVGGTPVGMIVDAELAPGPGGGLRWLSLDGGALRDTDGAVLASNMAMRPGRTIRCRGAGALVVDAGRAWEVTSAGEQPAEIVDICETETALCANASGYTVWASGGRLLCKRTSAQAGAPERKVLAGGPEVLGTVLPGQTRLWLGEHLGLGFYRAGNLHVAFVFDVRRRGLNDGVELPPIRGRIVDMHAAVGQDRAWLFWREQRGPREVACCALVSAQGVLLAAAEEDTAGATAGSGAWILAGRGSAAVGSFLFVPTDAGIVRVEEGGGTLAMTRSFPDTEPFVCAGDRLLAGADGLYVVKRDHILRLTLS